LRQIAKLPEYPTSRPWPMFGMLALGLVAGAALGGYAVAQRSQMKRLASYAHRMGDEMAAMGSVDAVKPVAVDTSTRSNHRRKATSEV
jgi:predicted ATP-grasp superfamily ATP-dependent carboligase